MVLLLSSKPCCEVNGAALAASFFENLAGGLAQPRAADYLAHFLHHKKTKIRRPALLVSSVASLPYHYFATLEDVCRYLYLPKNYFNSALLVPGLDSVRSYIKTML